MTVLRLALAAALALVVTPARALAQHSNRAIAVESGVSASARGGGAPAIPVAVSATTWLEGEVHLVARVAFLAAPETAGRGADPRLAGTVGLRATILPDPVLRPDVFLELGWARAAGGGDRVAYGAGAGLEWFFAADVAASLRAAVRGVGDAAARLDLCLGLAAYF